MSTLDAIPFLDRMADCMSELNFGLFSFDHEGGDAQFEFDFAYDEALRPSCPSPTPGTGAPGTMRT